MFSNDGDKIRAFPFRPSPSPCGLTDYIEYSGCNALLIQAVKKLYEVPNKPENPIEWLRLYFKYLAEDVAAAIDPIGVASEEVTEEDDIRQHSMDSTNADFTQNPCQVEIRLQQELTEIESELISCFEAEAQNKAVIDHLEHELKNVTLSSTKSQYHDDFRRYLDQREDYHYRIKPDPLYQPSLYDMLLEDDENVHHQQQQQRNQSNISAAIQGMAPKTYLKEDSIVELVPFDPTQWAGDVTAPHTARQSQAFWKPGENKLQKQNVMMYEDYPILYFPERQWKPEEEEEEEIEMDEEGEEGEALEELEEEGALLSVGVVGGGKEVVSESGKGKKTGREESEYDGGSEGESDQLRSPRTKSLSPYTPRSAHDKKHNKASKHSQKSHHNKQQQPTTNDKNV